MAKHQGEDHPVVMTFEILEKKKAEGAAALSLGAELIITHGRHYHEVFEDLDEILASFVTPYMRNFNAAVGHRKFVAGNAATIREAANQQAVSPIYHLPLFPSFFIAAVVQKCTGVVSTC